MTKLVKSNKVSALLILMLAVFLFTATASAAPTYNITDLGTLGGTYSYAYGVNSSGQVVGWSSTAGDTVFPAFLYRDGTMQDLSPLVGTDSVAYAINDSDQVVGRSSDHAFLYSGGTVKDLGGSYSIAHGINNSGQVVGSSSDHAFLYSGGAMVDLGTLPGGSSSLAYGINDSAQVVGSSFKGLYYAFLYSGGTMVDLGNLGGLSSYSEALAINNLGQVVGYSGITNDAASHAFLYDGTLTPPMRDLGTLGGTNSNSYAYGINNSGQVVGSSEIAGGTNNHAFLYEGGTMYDLNNLIPPSSGWVLTYANGINDGGQIVGVGTIIGKDGYHAFLLKPVADKSLSISIDIRPWSHINSINLKSRGKIPVAILSTKEFDAPSQVDRNSLTFGRTGDEQSLAFCDRRPEHVNRDGLKDLVCHFYIQETDFQCDSTKGTLRGKKLDGKAIEGSDSIRIVPSCKKVPCKHENEHKEFKK